MRQVVFSQVEPSNSSVTIEAPTTEAVTITFWGSCYSTVNSVMTGLSVNIDGQTVAKAELFSNNAEQHQTVTAVSFEHTFPYTQDNKHKISIETLDNTTVDSNDRFTLVIDY